MRRDFGGPYRVWRFGCGVAEALADLRQRDGRVIATYRHAVLIATTSGRLLALQESDGALSPFSVNLTPAPRQWPSLNQGVSIDQDVLIAGPLVVALLALGDPARSAPIHESEPRIDAAGNPLFASDPGVLASLMRAARTSSFGAWWGPTVVQSDSSAQLAASRGLTTLRRLTDGVRTSNAELALSAAGELLGLGPGLTPSGDDALAGFLGAWLRLSPPLLDDSLRQRLLQYVVARAASSTTPVAAEFFYHLGQHRLSEPLELVIEAVASGVESRVTLSVGDLLRWGSSSGADTLAGVCALLIASRRSPPPWHLLSSPQSSPQT